MPASRSNATHGAGDTVRFLFFSSSILPPHPPQTRLAKYYIPLDDADKRTLEYDVHRCTSGRDPGFAAVADYKGAKLIFRRYAGLYFTLGADAADNELLLMEAIHLFVEVRKRGGGLVGRFFCALPTAEHESVGANPPFSFSSLQILDHYFGNVCELDLVFNFHKVRRREEGKRNEGRNTKNNQSNPPPSSPHTRRSTSSWTSSSWRARFRRRPSA